MATHQVGRITTLRRSAKTTVAGTGAYESALASGLYSPCVIALISSNVLYIADQYAGEANGVAGSSSFDLNLPSSVYVDSSYNIYLTDTGNHRIQLWHNGASSGTTVAGTGTSGNTSTQLYNPRNVTMDSSSNMLYVADTDNHRIMSYVLNSSVGIIVAGGNGVGTLINQFVVIANCGVYTIVQWVIGSSGWTILVGCVGIYGSSPLMLYGPMGATLDSMGNIYVADAYTHRIQFFSTGQRNGTTIAGVSGTTGMLSSQLNSPRSIALDNQLNMYVSN
ncbi:unnamed protein product [Rotaria magnacalcarata]|uniref:NHL repeat containing protein n=1 Tax=Rotaria magnacalcarata TaxID=392030 RepID=A0A819L232_9BILA|nr:unnamed protein product [Rotaria magnacalcarata]